MLLAGIAQATEQLGGMFWPESTEPPAQATLRDAHEPEVPVNAGSQQVRGIPAQPSSGKATAQ